MILRPVLKNGVIRSKSKNSLFGLVEECSNVIKTSGCRKFSIRKVSNQAKIKEKKDDAVIKLLKPKKFLTAKKPILNSSEAIKDKNQHIINKLSYYHLRLDSARFLKAYHDAYIMNLEFSLQNHIDALVHFFLLKNDDMFDIVLKRIHNNLDKNEDWDNILIKLIENGLVRLVMKLLDRIDLKYNYQYNKTMLLKLVEKSYGLDIFELSKIIKQLIILGWWDSNLINRTLKNKRIPLELKLLIIESYTKRSVRDDLINIKAINYTLYSGLVLCSKSENSMSVRNIFYKHPINKNSKDGFGFNLEWFFKVINKLMNLNVQIKDHIIGFLLLRSLQLLTTDIAKQKIEKLIQIKDTSPYIKHKLIHSYLNEDQYQLALKLIIDELNQGKSTSTYTLASLANYFTNLGDSQTVQNILPTSHNHGLIPTSILIKNFMKNENNVTQVHHLVEDLKQRNIGIDEALTIKLSSFYKKTNDLESLKYHLTQLLINHKPLPKRTLTQTLEMGLKLQDFELSNTLVQSISKLQGYQSFRTNMLSLENALVKEDENEIHLYYLRLIKDDLNINALIDLCSLLAKYNQSSKALDVLLKLTNLSLSTSTRSHLLYPMIQTFLCGLRTNDQYLIKQVIDLAQQFNLLELNTKKAENLRRCIAYWRQMRVRVATG